MQPRIQDIDEPDLPNNSDFFTNEEMDEMENDNNRWVRGKLIEDCSICHDTGCPYCGNYGY